MQDTMPYTYLIGWSKLDIWYYGVKYAMNANPKGLWKTYFSSSQSVQDVRLIHGEPDVIQVRKTFTNAESAISWETKVLKRMNCAKRSNFLNRHNNTAFTPMYGELNPSKRPDVRMKLSAATTNRLITDNILAGRVQISITKTVKNIVNILTSRAYTPKRCHIGRLKRYIQFIVSEYPNHVYTVRKLQKYLSMCENIQPKPYPKNRKSSPRGKMPNISIAKMGKKWFYDPFSLKTKPYFVGEEPLGWIRGMIKNTPNNSTPEQRKKLSDAQKKHRASESEEQKSQRLELYHATIEKRKSNKNNAAGASESC